MKKEFVKHVYRNEFCNSEDVDYGRVRIKESKWCPFLNEKKLCRIYINLGEDFLSNVCYSYPRVYNVLNDVYELSLYMSCPEAIRKLLASSEPIEFIEHDHPLEKHIIHNYLDTKDSKWSQSPLLHLKDLRAMSIEIIQNREYPLRERLLTLGKKLYEKKSAEPSAIHNKRIFLLGFFRDALDSLNVFSEIDSPVFVSYTKKLIRGLRLHDDISTADKAGFYQEISDNIVNPFLEENGYLFEHYLVNFMFQNNFPFTENQNQFDGFLMLVVRYAFIKFYLAGIAVAEGKISKEDVILMIQIYTKTVEHHKTFIVDLLQDIKQKHFDNMDFASSLLIF